MKSIPKMTTQQILQKHSSIEHLLDTKKIFLLLSTIFIVIISLTIFQDFLDSHRVGYSFYFSESILFKTIWLLFIPILAVLHKALKNNNSDTFYKTAIFIIVPVMIHFIILPFVVLFFSILFYDGRYDLYKVITFTLANDLYKLVGVYAAFVLIYKYLTTSKIRDVSKGNAYLQNIVVGNGKENTIVKVDDILYITSATPYITVQLKNKKYLHTETLKSISNQLDHNIFVRVHKSTIVNRSKVVSFKSRLNGDYDLLLINGYETRLSRTYAPHFKNLFKTNHQVTV